MLASVLALLALAPNATAERRARIFHFTGTVRTFPVPEGVHELHVRVVGGHGQWTNRTNTGGRAGLVTAHLPVHPGDVLDVYVGGYGGSRGGWGYGHGGGGGGSTDWGHDGQRGGGGSAILAIDDSPLLVAGGGGAGGGDGAGDGYYGGRGGDGGRPAHKGEGARHGSGGDGGQGGCEGCRGIDGGGGHGSEYGSGGGGGGGGYAGGGGGHGGDGVEAGGGGGGGGLSYAAPSAQDVHFGVSATASDRADGNVRISWVPNTPSAVAVYGDSSGQAAEVGTPFGRGLQARVTGPYGDPVAHARVRFSTPASGATGTFAGAHTVSVTADGNGVATAPPLTAGLVAGAWTATASADGTSAQARFSLADESAQTTMALSPSEQPSAFGQPVHYTAYVTAAPTAGTPRGTVSFTVDGAPLGDPVALVGGTATSASIASLRPGPHKVTAAFSPASSTWAAASSAASQSVEPALTTLHLTSSDNPTELGHVLFFTAAVAAAAPGGGTPDGKVAFSVDGNPLETVDLVDGTARTGAGWASLAGGNFQVLATYLPGGDADDPENLPRYVTTAASLDQAVGPGTTATTVTSSAEPAVAGQPVTLTATVDGREVLAPTGTVTFTFDGAEICRNVALAPSDGHARALCHVDAARLAVGEHQILARYSGSPGQSLQPSSGGLTQRVERASVALELLSQPDPTAFGQPLVMSVALTAADPGRGTPTGTVQFLANGRPIGLPRPLDGSGAARLGLVGELPAGPLAISARYSGDGRFLPRESSQAHAIARGPTAVALSPSAAPSAPGAAVTFAARVGAIGPAFGNPGGQVQFRLDGEPLGEPVDVDHAGRAVSPPTPGLVLGDHNVTASYVGDHDFLPSQAAITQRVALGAPRPSGAGGPAGGGAAPGPGHGRCVGTPVLTRLVPHAGRVHVAGYVPAGLLGRPVAITARGRVVARATARGDGAFSASARLPRGRHWRATRYRASVAGHRSPAVRLVQRLRLGYRWLAIGGRLRVRVRVRPGGRRRARRIRLTLQRSRGCVGAPWRRAGTRRTGRHGRATLTLAPPPAGHGPAVYRVRAGRLSSPAIVVDPEVRW